MSAITFSPLGVESLQILAALEEFGSISETTRRLHCTPPAIAQHLTGLKKAVGADLVVAGRNGVVLTPIGRALAQHGRRITETLREAERAVGKHQDRPSSPSDLATTMAVADLVGGIIAAATPLAMAQILGLVDQRLDGDPA